MTQLEAFPNELRSLSRSETIDSKGSHLQLNPFIDQGLIKEGDRLIHANLPDSRKHPILLPKNHQISKIIIRDEHIKRMHAGVSATLYGVRETFWPINGRNYYIMGNFPKNRVSFTRPFTNVGVDYCGPFFIKERRHRNRVKIKTYVSIFVCLATKAVHLELASDLTTEAFLACLKRFFARRGHSDSISFDNVANFVGADRELREVYQRVNSIENNKEIQTFLAKKGINWHFIPPRAPHFGRLWEAAVKSFKTHFTRIVGRSLLTRPCKPNGKVVDR